MQRPLISILKGTKKLVQSKIDKVTCEDFPDISSFFKLAFDETKILRKKSHRKLYTIKVSNYDSSR